MDVVLQFALETLLPSMTAVGGAIIGFALLTFFVTSLFQFIANQ